MVARMTNGNSPITFKPIGVVRNGVKKAPDGRDWWVELISKVDIEKPYTEALDGLEGFSHIIVLYWLHRIVESKVPLKIHPMDRQEAPLVGLFATRTPNRPNRLGMATVRLLQRQDNVLKVKGLDALDGTPVIDIKPFIPGYDSPSDCEVPQWITSR